MEIIGKQNIIQNSSPSWKRLSLYLKRSATYLQKPAQRFGPLMSKEAFRCAVKGVIPLYTKRHSHLQTISASGQNKMSSGTFSLLLLFWLSIQLCRLWSAHSFKDFVFSGITPLAAHRKLSSLVRGPNHCGGFCRCVAGLFKESDGLFHDGELFSSADSSLFTVHKASR